ncbi:hypothetical protein QJS10_CPB15g02156 [Acorus calamus]|uniref:Uncharacterized protein n=1 Tax=Acorus calamus TaxID=4465 RepID=A0AAV9D509_ACOCL|nr:hypothetical protein QJS10_CPB15g02156 [Acorus calamus]
MIVVVETEVVHPHGFIDLSSYIDLTDISSDWTSSSSLSITHKTRDLGANKTANLIYWESAICMIADL